ncbi:vivid PAS protein VVD [Xylaria bambusicola]|uniref:vivid PAS protein VVD n=1 Tax=Xylaria bambusicola TaxID=326684 RepID=UPI002008AB38|nr:vivid PAS protein VVD [Xylaria bambusicola]KAI0515015.1 vivid PAS protein VVD [Xylaria bambusicola]
MSSQQLKTISPCHFSMTTRYHIPKSVFMNPWEYNALEYNYSENEAGPAAPRDDTVTDSIIYPGIYAPSGFDILGVLSRVAMRTSPVVHLPAVDASCAIVVCDIQQPDYPVVYANEACTQLTGYPLEEMLGKNCRFMQAPGGKVRKSSTRSHVEKSVLKKMRRTIESNGELVIEVTNFKKNGQKFTNIITIIPIPWDTASPRYYVGFLAEKAR